MKNKNIYFRVLETNPTKGGKTLRIALVSEIVDSYDTVINPRGCVSALESVPVDLGHSRVATECRLIDVGIGQVEVPTSKTNESGQVISELKEARIVDVYVPENAREWTKDNQDKRAEEVPSLYDDIAEYPNNRYRWGSVDFTPVEIAEIFDQKGNKIREEYPKWRLNFFSLLKTKPGQDTSHILSIRSLENSNKNQKNTDMDKQNKDQNKDQNNQEEVRSQEDGQVQTQEPENEEGQKRGMPGRAVKNKSGELGVITESSKTMTNNETTSNYKIELLDGSVIEYQGDIGWSDEDDDREWLYADTGELILKMLKMNAGNNNNNQTQRSEPENDGEEDQKKAELTRQIQEKEDKNKELENQNRELQDQNKELKEKFEELETKNKKLSETIQKIRNSPEAIEGGEIDGQVDKLDGASENSALKRSFGEVFYNTKISKNK